MKFGFAASEGELETLEPANMTGFGPAAVSAFSNPTAAQTGIMVRLPRGGGLGLLAG